MLLRIFVSIFLLLGITNPVMGNLIDIAISGFVFGLTTYYVLGFFNKTQSDHKKFLITSGVLLVTSWILMSRLKGFEPVYIYSSLLGYLIAALAQKFKILEKSAIWILIIVFLLNSFVISYDLRIWLGLDIPYNNDPGVFLATYKSIEGGQDYYESFKSAMLVRFSEQIVPKDIWGWRLPTIFYVWKVLPGGALSIYLLYLLFSIILLCVVYQMARIFLPERLALLSPYLLFPYLHFGARDQMFLITEWWAAIVFIFAIYFVLKKHLFISTVLFSFTLLIRELYILPIGLMLICVFILQRRLIPVFLIPIISFFIFFIYHVYRVDEYIDAWGTLLSARIVDNGFLFLQQTFAFASWEYLVNQIRPFYFLVLAAIIGCVYIFKFQNRQEAVFLLLAFLPFPISFLKFGTLPFNDYWGVFYMPTAIILAPLALSIFKSDYKKRQGSL